MTTIRTKSHDSLRTLAPLAVKATTTEGEIEGYGSVFGNSDSYGEIVEPGAFAKSLTSGRRVLMLWQHDTHQPIGQWTEAREDARGLYLRGRLNLGVKAGQEAHALLKAGDIGGLSIGYREVTTRQNSDGTVSLLELDLREVSVVSMPANEAATVTRVKQLGSQADLEKLLRDAGLARGAATKIAGPGWLALRNNPDPNPSEIDRLLARVKAASADLRSLKG